MDPEQVQMLTLLQHIEQHVEALNHTLIHDDPEAYAAMLAVLNNFQIVPFEQVKSSNPWIRISREKFYIIKFNPSLNKRI